MIWALARLSRLAGGSRQSPTGGPSRISSCSPLPGLVAAAGSTTGWRAGSWAGSSAISSGCTASAGSPPSSSSTAAIDGWRPSASARPNGSVGSSTASSTASAGPVAPRRADQPLRGTGQSGNGRAHRDAGEHQDARPRRRRRVPRPRRSPRARAERVGDGGPQPTAGRRQLLGRGPQRGRPAGQGGQPRHGQASTRVPPMTARAGSRRTPSAAPVAQRRPPAAVPSSCSSPRPMSMRTPTATSTRGTRNRPQPEQIAHGDPGALSGRAEGPRPAVEGDGAQHAEGDQADTPEIGGVAGGDRAHRGQHPARLAACGAERLPERPSRPARRALLRGGAPARSRRGCRLALGPRCPGSTRRTLGGGRHSGVKATPGPPPVSGTGQVTWPGCLAVGGTAGGPVRR